MLAQTERPRSFSDMVGAESPRRILQSIVLHPDKAPKSIILLGDWGSGKTTSARIFAKAINCTKNKTGDACLKCRSCLSEVNPNLIELDSAISGNVKALKDIAESFLYSVTEGYRVVVFDEFHLTPAPAQSVLLKILEEVDNNVFFIFCTTEINKIINPIRSRSLELIYSVLNYDNMKILLTKTSQKNKLYIDDDLIDIIYQRSHGHARDAIMLLELCSLQGIDCFKEGNKLLVNVFRHFIQAACSGDKDKAKGFLNIIFKNPCDIISQDFSVLVSELIEEVFIKNEGNDFDKNVLLSYLRNKKYLDSLDTWKIWLYSLVKSGTVKTNLVGNRFTK